MKRIAAAVVVLLIPIDALAVVRYLVQDMTCAEVQEVIERDGVTILYRQATSSGLPIYDRYVKNGDLCDSGQDSSRASVPTADTDRCRVSKCIDQNRFGDR